MVRPRSRRTFLAATGSALLAGCSSLFSPDDPETTTGGRTPRSGNAAPADAWPGVGRDSGHSGFNPALAGTEPTTRWEIERSGTLSTPTVADGTVYVTRSEVAPEGWIVDAALEAYDLATGDRTWHEPLGRVRSFGATSVAPGPIYHRSTVYVNTDRRIAAFDADTHERYWTARFEKPGDGSLSDRERYGSVTGRPVAFDGGVIATGVVSVADADSDRIEARDVVVRFDDDGTERWRFAPSDGGDPNGGYGIGVSPGLPAVMDGSVYVPLGRSVVALDPRTGEATWRTGSAGPIFAAELAAAGGTIARGDRDHVEVLNADGTLRWRVSGFDGAIGRPVVADDAVYAAGHEGTVVAYDVETGERRWRNQVGPVHAGIGIVPRATGNAVHVLRTERGYGGPTRVVVRALDRGGGAVEWKRTYRATDASGPIPAEGAYVLTTRRTERGTEWDGSEEHSPVTTLRTLAEMPDS